MKIPGPEDKINFLNDSDIESVINLTGLIRSFEHFYSGRLEVFGTKRSECVIESNGTWISSAIAAVPHRSLAVSKTGTEAKVQGRTYGESVLTITDTRSGRIVFIASAEVLTAARVAASTVALYDRHFAGHKGHIGVFGSGRLAYWLIAALKAAGHEGISLVGRDPQRLAFLKQEIGSRQNLEVEVLRLGLDSIPAFDFIFLLTAAEDPFLADEALANVRFCASLGAHGSGMKEVPLSIFRRSDVILVDSIDGVLRAGDLNDALHRGAVCADLIKLAEKFDLYEPKDGRTLLWKSVGDIRYDAVAALCLFDQIRANR